MKNKIKQAIIFAGGKGERLFPYTKTTPKPLISINGKPFIYYLIKRLASYNIKEVIILTGYRFEDFKALAELFKNENLIIKCLNTPVHYETGNRILEFIDHIDDIFFALYGDNYWPFNLDDLYTNFIQKKFKAQIVAYNNYDRYSSSNLIVQSDEKISYYDTYRKNKDCTHVDLGFGIFSKSALDCLDSTNNVSFQSQVYKKLIDDNSLGAFDTKHRYYTLTNLNRMSPLNFIISDSKYAFVNLDLLNFTLNEMKYNYDRVSIPGSFLTILNKLKNKKYKIILIAYVPDIEKELIRQPEVDRYFRTIIEKFKELNLDLLNNIYMCPHLINSDCECNEKSLGLFLQAQRDLFIDLSKAVYFSKKKNKKLELIYNVNSNNV